MCSCPAFCTPSFSLSFFVFFLFILGFFITRMTRFSSTSLILTLAIILGSGKLWEMSVEINALAHCLCPLFDNAITRQCQEDSGISPANWLVNLNCVRGWRCSHTNLNSQLQLQLRLLAGIYAAPNDSISDYFHSGTHCIFYAGSDWLTGNGGMARGRGRARGDWKSRSKRLEACSGWWQKAALATKTKITIKCNNCVSGGIKRQT